MVGSEDGEVGKMRYVFESIIWSSKETGYGLKSAVGL